MNSFIEIKNMKESFKKEYIYQLDYYKKELIKVNDQNNQQLIRFYTDRISEYLKKIDDIKYEITYMRDNNKEDLELRDKIKRNYSKLVKDTIPSYIDASFFGIKDIRKIEKIVKTGIVSLDKINITNKENIRTSLEEADNNITSYLPYGAIFAIKPCDIESKCINLKESQDRLYGIITTQENIITIQNWCLESGIDINKVFTHKDFLMKCEDIFKEPNYKHGKI